MGNVLNLKDSRAEHQEAVEKQGDASVEQEQVFGEDGQLTEEARLALSGFTPEAVAWETSTRPNALERRKEHVMLGILATLAVAVAIWQQSVALVFIAGLTILAWEMQHRHGHDIQVAIDQKGISVNGRRHRFDRFKSFHIQELPDGSRHLSVMPASVLSPAVRAPLGEQDYEEVHAILSSYLVEDDHPIPISELFLKS